MYQRDGRIVRVGMIPVKGHKPTLQFIEVGKENLIETLTSIITFMKYDGRSEKEKVVNCPIEIAATTLVEFGNWKLPVIRAIITPRHCARMARSSINRDMMRAPGYIMIRKASSFTRSPISRHAIKQELVSII